MLCGWENLTSDQRELIVRGIRQNRPLGGPFHLEIHPTNQCTVNCFACYCRACRHGETLPWELLERLLRDAAARGLGTIRLSGGGESLMYPQIGELLGLLGELKVRIGDLTTNATCLQPVAESLIRVGTDYVLVSLNESDPDRYGRMMQVKPALFQQAVAGVEALCRARDAAPAGAKPRIALQFLIWRDNYRHVAEMYSLGLKLGADHIVIKTVDGLTPDLQIPAEGLPEAQRRLTELLHDDGRSGRFRLRLDLCAHPYLNHELDQERRRLQPPPSALDHDFVQHTPRIHYCFVGWVSMLVSASGLVYPCCPMYGMPGKEIGNIYQESLESIWTGPRQQRFRTEIRRLMLLDGQARHSRRLMKILEPVCLSCFGCPFSYRLFNTEMYQEIAERFSAGVAFHEKFTAQVMNAICDQGHRALSYLKSRHPVK